MSVPNSSVDIEILPAEFYVLVDPGVFRNIEGFVATSRLFFAASPRVTTDVVSKINSIHFSLEIRLNLRTSTNHTFPTAYNQPLYRPCYEF